MKKSIWLWLMFWLFPLSVYAYDITCDDGPFTYNNAFSCVISNETLEEYSTLTGKITPLDSLSCSLDTVGKGLSIVSTDENVFSLKGKSTEKMLATLKCQVTTKITADEQSQVTIDDFHYQTSTKEETLILRSNYINLKKYEEPTQNNEKSRDTSDSNTLLSALYIDNAEIIFSKFITEYWVNVSNDVTKLNITTTPINKDAKVEIKGANELVVGDNIIDIYVTSPDGQKNTVYTIYVKRLAEGENVVNPQSDATLRSLNVKNAPITFSADKYEYDINILYEASQIELEYVPSHSNANVEVLNNYNLVNGSVVTVKVTSSDGTNVIDYHIRIHKEEPRKDYTYFYLVGGFAALVLVIALIIWSITKKRKQKKQLASSNTNNENIGGITITDDNSVAPTPVAMPQNNSLNSVSTNVNTLVLNDQGTINPTPVSNTSDTTKQV